MTSPTLSVELRKKLEKIRKLVPEDKIYIDIEYWSKNPRFYWIFEKDKTEVLIVCKEIQCLTITIEEKYAEIAITNNVNIATDTPSKTKPANYI